MATAKPAEGTIEKLLNLSLEELIEVDISLATGTPKSIRTAPAVVWETRSHLTSKVLYGRAFRPPSFSKGHNQNNPVIFGNLNLDSKTIYTWEPELDYRLTDILQLQFNLYYYDIKGFIDYVTDPGGATFTVQKARDQEGYGFELEADWRATRTFLLIKGNVACQHSKDRNTEIAEALQWQTFLNGHCNFLEHRSLDSQGGVIGDRKRVGGSPLKEIDDLSLVNPTLRRKNIANHWNVAFLAKNLSEMDAREPSYNRIPNDLPLEGRSIWGEVRFYVQ